MVQWSPMLSPVTLRKDTHNRGAAPTLPRAHCWPLLHATNRLKATEYAEQFMDNHPILVILVPAIVIGSSLFCASYCAFKVLQALQYTCAARNCCTTRL